MIETTVQALHRAVAYAPDDDAPKHALADFLMELGGDNWARGEDLHRKVAAGTRAAYPQRGVHWLTTTERDPLSAKWGFPLGVRVTAEFKGFPAAVEFEDWDHFRLAPHVFDTWPITDAGVRGAAPARLAGGQWSWALSSGRGRLGGRPALARFEVPKEVAVWGLLHAGSKALRPAGGGPVSWWMNQYADPRKAVRSLGRALVCRGREMVGFPRLDGFPERAPLFRGYKRVVVYNNDLATLHGETPAGGVDGSGFGNLVVLGEEDFPLTPPPAGG